VLLFAHALVVLFSVGLGFLLMLPRARDWGASLFLTRLWPFAPQLVGGVLLFLVEQHGPGGGAGTIAGITVGPLLLRLLGPLAAVDDRPEVWTFVALVALLALPFLGGLRLEVRPVERAIIVAAVFGALALGPDWAWVASGIYRRFALFAPAAWAWLFSDADAPADGLARMVRPRLALAASALTGLILAQHIIQAEQFAHETGDFEAVLASARPGERALGLVLNKESSADVDLHVYWPFPSWYQAEKGGLVDPSFAAGAPSIVRYRENPPGLYSDPAIGEHPERFDWRRDRGDQWTYFFVRGAVPSSLFAGAECPPVKVKAQGAWTLFEKRQC